MSTEETMQLDEVTTLRMQLSQSRVAHASDVLAAQTNEQRALLAEVRARCEENGKYELIDVAIDGKVKRKLREAEPAAKKTGPKPKGPAFRDLLTEK